MDIERSIIELIKNSEKQLESIDIAFHFEFQVDATFRAIASLEEKKLLNKSWNGRYHFYEVLEPTPAKYPIKEKECPKCSAWMKWFVNSWLCRNLDCRYRIWHEENAKSGKEGTDMPKQKLLKEIKPCPWCGQQPEVFPKDQSIEGSTWGEVRCVNEECPAAPRVTDGSRACDERGSVAYQNAAIRRWNKRLGV